MKTFKQFISEGKQFDRAEHGKPITIHGVHYNTSTNKIKVTPGKEFYFSDDHSWSSPHMENNTVHAVKATFKNPAVFKNSEDGFETEISDKISDLKSKGHDGIIYTPKNSKLDNPQAVHFYPEKGIEIKERNRRRM